MKKNFVTFLIFLFLCSPLFVSAQTESPFGEAPQNPENPGLPTDPGTAENTGPRGALGQTQEAGTTGQTPVLNNAGTGSEVQDPLSAKGNGLLPLATRTSKPTSTGRVLYAGNGNNTNFWQYLLSLIGGNSLNGQKFQSQDKNQETSVSSNQPDKVLEFTNQWTAPTPIKTISQKSSSSPLKCGFNQSNKTLGGYIGMATCFMFYLIPVIIALLVLWFMFGSIKYINDSEHEERGQYKIFLTWGVIILFVALSFVGILRVMTKTLGL